MSATRQQPSSRAVTAPDDAVLFFEHGLVGCEDWKRFVLLTDDRENLPVGMLQSMDDPAVSLLVTDPRLVVPDYAVALTREERAQLGLPEGAEPVLYCTLTVGAEGWITANLLGPLAVNPRTRRGKQLVLADSAYSTRHPVGRLDESGAVACSS